MSFDLKKPAILYYARVDVEPPVYKIGVSNGPFEDRYPTADRRRMTLLREFHYRLGKWAKAFERQWLMATTDDTYTGPDLLSSGNSELRTRDFLELDNGNNAKPTAEPRPA